MRLNILQDDHFTGGADCVLLSGRAAKYVIMWFSGHRVASEADAEPLGMTQDGLPEMIDTTEFSQEVLSRAQSLMKLANKRGNEVGPEVVDEVESESINVVSNTQLKVRAC